MKQIILFLLLLVSGASLADSIAPDKLGELRAELASVRDEQQSVYQNYQMVKEQRRIEVLEGSPPMAQHPYGMDMDTPPPNYEDVLRAQQERESRIEQYTIELGRLTARFLELEKEKKALLRQIRELEQPGQ
jgi:hypothetical protein